MLNLIDVEENTKFKICILKDSKLFDFYNKNHDTIPSFLIKKNFIGWVTEDNNLYSNKCLLCGFSFSENDFIKYKSSYKDRIKTLEEVKNLLIENNIDINLLLSNNINSFICLSDALSIPNCIDKISTIPKNIVRVKSPHSFISANKVKEGDTVFIAEVLSYDGYERPITGIQYLTVDEIEECEYLGFPSVKLIGKVFGVENQSDFVIINSDANVVVLNKIESRSVNLK